VEGKSSNVIKYGYEKYDYVSSSLLHIFRASAPSPVYTLLIQEQDRGTIAPTEVELKRRCPTPHVRRGFG